MRKGILVLSTLLIISLCWVFARDLNAEDVYHISSVEDWETFVSSIQSGETTFKETLINLDADLNIEGKNYSTRKKFEGTFDGNGHLITFTNEDLRNTSSVFPFQVLGTVKNVRIYAKDCIVDAVQHPTVTASLVNYGGSSSQPGTIENVSVYGNISIIPNPSKANNIECSGIAAGNADVRNCTVSLFYDLETQKIQEFIQSETPLNFRMRLFQFGGGRTTSRMNLSNSYCLGSYSDAFNTIVDSLTEFYNNKEDGMEDEFLLIEPIGHYIPVNNKLENCYFNSDSPIQLLLGRDASKEYVEENYLNVDSLAKSSDELKKQETFVDYDFENIWGISEYINDGYPYLEALVNKDLVALVDQIAALPKEDEITKDSKGTVEKIKEALAGLSEQDKALISFDALSDKVTKAEEAIKAIEEKEKEESEKQPEGPATISVKKGTKFTLKGYKYTVTGTTVEKPTVSIMGYKNKRLKKIVVPATVSYKGVKFTVTGIANKAFKGQKKATTASIGANVESIGKLAFNGDSKLKKITVRSIILSKVGAKAFKGIQKKAVIKVPKKKLKVYKKLLKGKGQAKTVKIK